MTISFQQDIPESPCDLYGVQEGKTYRFPECCCRCLADSPTKRWKVGNFQQERIDSQTTLVTTHSIEVPLCRKCYRDLINLRIQLVAAPVFIALCMGAAAWFNLPKDLNEDPKTLLLYGSVTVAMLLPVFGGLYFLLALIIAPPRTRNVAWMSMEGDKLVFYNQEYQRRFQNFGGPAPAEQDRGW